MAVSQNGYSANDRSVIASFTIPGTSVRMALRKGDTSTILLYVFSEFNIHVEPIEQPTLDDWGYAERPIRGLTTTLSNHASGTGGDVNAQQHVLGRANTFTPEQVRAIEKILAFCEGTVRWGGHYSGRKDEMHFEINKGIADCARVAKKIRALSTTPPATLPPPAPPHTHPPAAPKFPLPAGSFFGPKTGGNESVSGYFSHGDDLKRWQARMVQRGWNLAVDGRYGPATNQVVQKFQAEKRLLVDGKIGPATWAAAWTAPVR